MTDATILNVSIHDNAAAYERECTMRPYTPNARNSEQAADCSSLSPLNRVDARAVKLL